MKIPSEKVLLALAKRFATPLYIYSRQQIEENWRAFFLNKPANTLICYAVKANDNLAILNVFARLGAGFDIVSLGELERVLRVGADPAKILFSGVGKTEEAIERALDVNIFSFNVESFSELKRIEKMAKKKQRVASISLRVNPDIAIKSHPYITTGLKENKFGLGKEEFEACLAYFKNKKFIQLQGLACHIGSQICDRRPFELATNYVLTLAKQLKERGFAIDRLDLGGGLGVDYHEKGACSIEKYMLSLSKLIKNQPYQFILEPGRALIANAGLLLTRIEYLKKNGKKHFAIVDASMTELIRPALYEAWHGIVPVKHRKERPKFYDIVGPVCESADFLGVHRKLSLREGDYLIVKDVGAYGAVLSTNYNARPRATAVMLNKNEVQSIRERETVADLWSKELIV